MPDGEHLLMKNKIILESKIDKKSSIKEESANLVIQKPNKKMFGLISFRLGIYNLAYEKKENKFRWWLKNKVGEAPVIYNEKISAKSADNIRINLYNKGFLHAQVNFTTNYDKKKISVAYSLIPGELFTIGHIKAPTETSNLYKHIEDVAEETLLNIGDPFDINVLDAERKRIATHLRNMGYFNFRKDYVVFQLDSSNTKKTIDISMEVKEPTPGKWHEKFTINNIYILNEQILSENDSMSLDTVLYKDFIFIETEQKYKPKIIANGIFFKKGEYFRLDFHENTLRKLANYGTFKFVDIQFLRVDKNDKPHLDVFIYLTSGKKQSISVDVEANHNFIGLTGSQIGVTYQNRNISKSADLFEVKVSTGVEFNVGGRADDLQPVNNADVVIETNYYLNRFLVPFPLKKVSIYNNVKTKISLQYNFERRIGFYSLHSNSASFGYEWNESSKKKHLYNPIAVTLLITPERNITPIFQERLDAVPSLRRSFEEQFILGSNYTFFYNNKKTENDRSYMVFKGNVAMAGNLIHSIIALTKQARNNTTPYQLFSKEYSQFARFEATLIHNYKIGNHASVNTRFNTGIILPFGNSSVAPYFQQFFVGGSNSIRAFRLRAVGPGTYIDLANIDNPNFFFDQAGDFKLEGNAELRFDIYKFIKAAIFVDAGNVWLLRDDPDREGGTIAKDNFLNAIAVGAGFGLRLDFDYFIIRTDFAIPVVDPRFVGNEKYPLSDFRFSFGKNSWFRDNSVFHLAIGYPF